MPSGRKTISPTNNLTRMVQPDSRVAIMPLRVIAISYLSEQLRQRAATREHQDHDPGRHLPDDEQEKAEKREREITRMQHRAGPDRIVKRRSENADHSGVGAAH